MFIMLKLKVFPHSRFSLSTPDKSLCSQQLYLKSLIVIQSNDGMHFTQIKASKVEHSTEGVDYSEYKFCGACGIIGTSIVFLLSQRGGQKFNPAGSNRCFKSEHVGQSDDIWKGKKA